MTYFGVKGNFEYGITKYVNNQISKDQTSDPSVNNERSPKKRKRLEYNRNKEENLPTFLPNATKNSQ